MDTSTFQALSPLSSSVLTSSDTLSHTPTHTPVLAPAAAPWHTQAPRPVLLQLLVLPTSSSHITFQNPATITRSTVTVSQWRPSPVQVFSIQQSHSCRNRSPIAHRGWILTPDPQGSSDSSSSSREEALTSALILEPKLGRILCCETWSHSHTEI